MALCKMLSLLKYLQVEIIMPVDTINLTFFI